MEFSKVITLANHMTLSNQMMSFKKPITRIAQFPYGKGHIAFSQTRLFLEHILEHFIPGKWKLHSVYLRIRN